MFRLFTLKAGRPSNDLRAQRKGFVGGAFFELKSLGYFLCACKESNAPARRKTDHQVTKKRPSAGRFKLKDTSLKKQKPRSAA